jgi:prepilin-type N-terminal cleavage/methylation domain-containing protein
MKNNLFSRTAGFTLIELLIVIAIIGVLSSVVLSQLNSGRGKGIDAAIKSDLNTVVAQSVLDYDGYPNSYAPSPILVVAALNPWTIAGTGVPGAPLTSILTTIVAHEGATASQALIQASNSNGGKLQWGVTATSFVIDAQLTTSGAGYWCIDSTGVAKSEVSALAANATKCL